MSARTASGTSGRGDLFAKEGDSSEKGSEADFSPDRKAREKSEAFGVNEAEDPLQLDHMLGFSGKYNSTVIAHPQDDSIYIKSMGSLVVVGDIDDVHKQLFLRGHDMVITSLAASPSGRFLASGQKGTVHFRGYAAPVFLWDLTTGERVSVLRGITEAVECLCFSDDEKFLCGAGADSLLYIWDLATGEVVFGTRLTQPAAVVAWVNSTTFHGRTSYELAIGSGSLLNKAIFSFEQLRVQWQLKIEPYNMPVQGGLVRQFLDMAVSPDRIFIYVGTMQGEMMVFRRDTAVFRALIPVCSNGLTGIAVQANGDILCGGGDGSLKRLRGMDMEWQVLLERYIKGPIASVNLSANDTEAIVGCLNGSVYRCLVENLSEGTVSQAHTDAVTCIHFNTRAPSTFVTGTVGASIKVWEVADYACLAELACPKYGVVMSLTMLADSSIVSGWEDGNIRCHDATLSREKWIIAGAHRGGVSSLASYEDGNIGFVLSGGQDGGVRVWRSTTREFVAEYTDHAKPVTKVLVDVQRPNLVHSCSLDASVVTYDIRAQQRVQTHISNMGVIVDMTQRLDGETELITADNSGKLLHWDVDIREPVLAVQDPTRVALSCCQVSPSGRFLAFAGEDTLLKVLDLRSGQVTSLGQGHSATIRSLHWTPDERQILTGGNDTCLCVWNFFLGGDAGADSGQ